MHTSCCICSDPIDVDGRCVSSAFCPGCIEANFSGLQQPELDPSVAAILGHGRRRTAYEQLRLQHEADAREVLAQILGHQEEDDAG